jgi:hypothetical protein
LTPTNAREFDPQFYFMFLGTPTDRRWPYLEFPLALSPRSFATQIYDFYFSPRADVNLIEKSASDRW